MDVLKAHRVQWYSGLVVETFGWMRIAILKSNDLFCMIVKPCSFLRGRFGAIVGCPRALTAFGLSRPGARRSLVSAPVLLFFLLLLLSRILTLMQCSQLFSCLRTCQAAHGGRSRAVGHVAGLERPLPRSPFPPRSSSAISLYREFPLLMRPSEPF